MAYTISDDCIMCGACADNCPCEAISEGDGKYEINADACVDCGSCAEVCPVGAPQEGLLRVNPQRQAAGISLPLFNYCFQGNTDEQ